VRFVGFMGRKMWCVGFVWEGGERPRVRIVMRFMDGEEKSGILPWECERVGPELDKLWERLERSFADGHILRT
jgi:hypothetical protein